MGLIVVIGEPGSRVEEVARLTAQCLQTQCLPSCEFLSPGRLDELVAVECGSPSPPDRAWPDLVTGIAARAALDHHLLLCGPDLDLLFDGFPGVLRVRIAASPARRAGSLMVDRRLPRAEAEQLLATLDHAAHTARRQRFTKARAKEQPFDLIFNADTLSPEQIAPMIAQAAEAAGVFAAGLLTSTAEVQIQFQTRLRLAAEGVHPAGRADVKRRAFANRSEEIFANLLDFYRIEWRYEPRSFAIAWDEAGAPSEQFTPDFYLPEQDLFIELTTMKQSLVTKKNRKVKLLRQLYPEVNIQVFYQRDFQNLIFKHGLQERPAEA